VGPPPPPPVCVCVCVCVLCMHACVCASSRQAAYAAVRSACELLCPGEGKELLDGVMNVHKYNK
jgi:hypothetical protein